MPKSCGPKDYRDSPESKFLFRFGLGLGTWTRACQIWEGNGFGLEYFNLKGFQSKFFEIQAFFDTFDSQAHLVTPAESTLQISGLVVVEYESGLCLQGGNVINQ